MLGAALIPAAAFAGGLAATWLVYAIARDSGRDPSGTSMLLAGVIVNVIAAALITFLKTLVSPSRAQQLLRWLTGFIDLPTPAGLACAALYVGAGCAMLLFDAGRLNLLALGDETAGTLGVDVPVIAWGLGLDRMAMIALGIHDIRELFTTDLDLIRTMRRRF